MRELQVLDDGHLKLQWGDRQEFFEQELAEMARSQLRRLIEQALVAEPDRYLVCYGGTDSSGRRVHEVRSVPRHRLYRYI